jgi:hypothetical protein
MMIEIGTKNQGSLLSTLKDPFIKDSISGITIRYTTAGRKPYWYALVEFKNGNTSGEQRLGECDTFEEIVLQVKLLLDELKNK